MSTSVCVTDYPKMGRVESHVTSINVSKVIISYKQHNIEA